MPLNSNGFEEASVDRQVLAVKQVESNGDDVAKDFAAKSDFEGFAKVPIVRVERTDISRYINNTEVCPEKLDSSFSLGKITNKYPIRFFDCKVNVARDDLDILKWNYMQQQMLVTCRVCKKSYSDLKKLRSHQATKHMIVYEGKPKKQVTFSDHVIVHEVKEYHKCRKCTKIFDSYRLLKSHTKKEHKKRKCYICFYCTKSFVDRTIFKVHIKLHCDVCSELFPSRAKYIEHRRLKCRVFKLHKCRTCDLSFFNFMDLKDHSYEHLSTFFICDICKDQFESKCAVAHHIKFLHSGTRRPKTLYEIKNIGGERLFLCNFCDEASVDKDLIERHVESLPDLSNRAMTGYKDYYFCDQCLKKFDKEQEMLQHKWSHFLKPSHTDKKLNRECTSKEGADKKVLKRFFNVNEKIPECFLPKVVVKKKKLENYQLSDIHFEKSSVENLNVGKSAVENLNVGKSSDEILNVGKSAVENSNVGKSAVENSNVGKSAVENSNVGKSAVENLNVGKSSVENLNVGNSSVDNLNIGKSLLEILNGGKSSDEILNVGKSAVENMNVGKSSVENLNVGNSSVDNLNVGKSLLEILNGGKSSDEILNVGNSSVENLNVGNVADNRMNEQNQLLKKAVIDPKRKRTLISNHQCDFCAKYFSSGYCLRRHIQTVHCDYENLKCHYCEETFVWPSLLQTHKCIRAPVPEMPFDDARPEIHFDNLNMVDMLNQQAAQELQELNGIPEDEYMNCIDFEIPAPVNGLAEYGTNYLVANNGCYLNGSSSNGQVMRNGQIVVRNGQTVVRNGQTVVRNGQTVIDNGQTVVANGKNVEYKIVMQEVPIEF